MQKYQDVIFVTVSSGTTPLASATVQVNLAAGGAATIYSDNGVTTAANPLTTDSGGRFSFYAADGRYNLVVTKTGYASQTVSDILLEDLADANVGVFSEIILGGISLTAFGDSAGLDVGTTAGTVAAGDDARFGVGGNHNLMASLQGGTTAEYYHLTSAQHTNLPAAITAAGGAILDDIDAASQRTTLGLGTAAVAASTAFEPADATILKDADIGVSVQAYDATIETRIVDLLARVAALEAI